MNTPAFEKPLPSPSAETQPYWDGMKEHRLVLQRCARCKQPRHYPRPMCEQCYSLESEWFESTRQGTVHSWTVAHHPFHMGFKRELPYTVVTIDLAEGVRIMASMAGDQGDRLSVDAAVTIGFAHLSDDYVVPTCELADT